MAIFPTGVSRAQVEEGREALRRARKFIEATAYDSAITQYRRASELFAATSRRDLYYYSLIWIADVYLRQTRMAEADSLLRALEGSVISELGEKHRVTAGLYRLTGYLRLEQDRIDEALEYAQRGLAIWTEAAPAEKMARAGYQHGVALVHLRRGDCATALQYLGQAEEIQEQYGNPISSGLVQTLMSTGEAYELLGDLEAGTRMYARVVHLLDSLGMGRTPAGASARHMLAVALKQSGRFEESLSAEREALSISRAVYGPQHVATAAALAHMGDHCVLAGEFSSAAPYYSEALDILTKRLPREHSSIFEIRRKQAHLLLAMGSADTAIQLYRAVISAHESSFGHRNPSLAALYTEAAEAFLRGGKPEEAIRILQKASAIIPAADSMMRADIMLRSGRALLALGMLRDAAHSLNVARTLLDSAAIRNPDLRSLTWLALGDLAEREGDPDGALASYEKAIAALSRTEQDTGRSSPWDEVPVPELRRRYATTLIAEGRILAGTAPLAMTGADGSLRALDAYDRASAVLAVSRESYRSEGAKLALQKDVQKICEEGIAVAARLYRESGDPRWLDRAFSLAERARGSVLLEGMERAQSSRHVVAPDDPAARENALRLKADRFQRMMEWTSSFGDRRMIPVYRRELLMTYQAIDALEDSLRRSSPFGIGTRPAGPRVTLAELRSTVDSGSCFVEFARGGGDLYAMVIGPTDAAIVSLGDAAVIDAAAVDMRRGVKSLDRARYLRAARSLYASLITPLKKYLGGARHLIIVPDGGLSYVPFEALVAAGKPARKSVGPESDFRAFRYLVEEYAVTYALSGTLYHSLKSEAVSRRERGTLFAGFAPVFRSKNAQGNRQQEHFLSLLDPRATRSITVDGRTFSELPYTLTEVREIAGLFTAAGDRSLFVTESNATEQSFKANASNAAIVHVATHGIIDEDRPSLSALLFSPSNGTPSPDDGVLYAGEVYDLRLDADLVVLSSCESGVGKLVPGEELMAMSRSFIYAGARNIAYTLWKVNDRLTGDLMRRFYRHVLRGESYAAALAGAKRELIARKESANPYFWAAVVLTGQ